MSYPTADLSPQRPAAGPRVGRGAWLAAIVGAICFLNSLPNDFVYDDLPIVRDNPRTHSLTNLSDIWLSDWWQPQSEEQQVTSRFRDRLYRPLTLHTFALNHALGGLAPIGYHAGNIALHALVCLLVWCFVQRLLADVAVSNITALVFAVHPIHCEAVANVVGRAEVLAALFLLSGLLVLLPTSRVPGWKRACGAAVLFLAGLACKETAVCYVPVALVGLHTLAKRPGHGIVRWWGMHAVILLAPLALYLPLRYVALDHHLLRDMPPQVLMNAQVWADLPHRWLHAFTIVGHYTRLVIAPAKLSANYGLAVIDPDGGPDALTWLGIATVIVTLVALVGYTRSSILWRRLAALTVMSIASYALISNTLLLIGVTLGERLLYWPSVPILTAIVAAVVHAYRYAAAPGRSSPGTPRLLRVCGVLLLVGLGLRSVVRNADWQSNWTLFKQDVQTYPQSAELNESWANELMLSLRDPERPDDVEQVLRLADRHLEAALRIHPQFHRAMQLRGRVLGLLGERERAMEYLAAASQLGPLDRVARELLAWLRDEAGEQANRLEKLAEALSTRPADAALRLEYGELLLQRGRDREALAEIEEAVRLAPANANALRLLGDVHVARNQSERAIETYRSAIAQDPSNWRVHTNLVPLLADDEPAAALRHAEQAHRLAPNELVTNVHLAEALAVNGRLGEALRLFRQIVPGLATDDPYRPAVEQRIRDLEQGQP